MGPREFSAMSTDELITLTLGDLDAGNSLAVELAIRLTQKKEEYEELLEKAIEVSKHVNSPNLELDL